MTIPVLLAREQADASYWRAKFVLRAWRDTLAVAGPRSSCGISEPPLELFRSKEANPVSASSSSAAVGAAAAPGNVFLDFHAGRHRSSNVDDLQSNRPTSALSPPSAGYNLRTPTLLFRRDTTSPSNIEGTTGASLTWNNFYDHSAGGGGPTASSAGGSGKGVSKRASRSWGTAVRTFDGANANLSPQEAHSFQTAPPVGAGRSSVAKEVVDAGPPVVLPLASSTPLKEGTASTCDASDHTCGALKVPNCSPEDHESTGSGSVSVGAAQSQQQEVDQQKVALQCDDASVQTELPEEESVILTVGPAGRGAGSGNVDVVARLEDRAAGGNQDPHEAKQHAAQANNVVANKLLHLCSRGPPQRSKKNSGTSPRQHGVFCSPRLAQAAKQDSQHVLTQKPLVRTASTPPHSFHRKNRALSPFAGAGRRPLSPFSTTGARRVEENDGGGSRTAVIAGQLPSNDFVFTNLPTDPTCEIAGSSLNLEDQNLRYNNVSPASSKMFLRKTTPAGGGAVTHQRVSPGASCREQQRQKWDLLQKLERRVPELEAELSYRSEEVVRLRRQLGRMLKEKQNFSTILEEKESLCAELGRVSKDQETRMTQLEEHVALSQQKEAEAAKRLDEYRIQYCEESRILVSARTPQESCPAVAQQRGTSALSQSSRNPLFYQPGASSSSSSSSCFHLAAHDHPNQQYQPLQQRRASSVGSALNRIDTHASSTPAAQSQASMRLQQDRTSDPDCATSSIRSLGNSVSVLDRSCSRVSPRRTRSPALGQQYRRHEHNIKTSQQILSALKWAKSAAAGSGKSSSSTRCAILMSNGKKQGTGTSGGNSTSGVVTSALVAPRSQQLSPRVEAADLQRNGGEREQTFNISERERQAGVDHEEQQLLAGPEHVGEAAAERVVSTAVPAARPVGQVEQDCARAVEEVSLLAAPRFRCEQSPSPGLMLFSSSPTQQVDLTASMPQLGGSRTAQPVPFPSPALRVRQHVAGAGHDQQQGLFQQALPYFNISKPKANKILATSTSNSRSSPNSANGSFVLATKPSSSSSANTTRPTSPCQTGFHSAKVPAHCSPPPTSRKGVVLTAQVGVVGGTGGSAGKTASNCSLAGPTSAVLSLSTGSCNIQTTRSTSVFMPLQLRGKNAASRAELGGPPTLQPQDVTTGRNCTSLQVEQSASRQELQAAVTSNCKTVQNKLQPPNFIASQKFQRPGSGFSSTTHLGINSCAFLGTRDVEMNT
ncbi:unnamed protein product [Amoebophrya sp. A120]|nr:unnamed protein product [Amoebophrya sp. A120]|eukprot:GSA120T00023401001.1